MTAQTFVRAIVLNAVPESSELVPFSVIQPARRSQMLQRCQRISCGLSRVLRSQLNEKSFNEATNLAISCLEVTGDEIGYRLLIVTLFDGPLVCKQLLF